MTVEQDMAKKPQVLLELRPAFDGYQGIPQETRLLFRGLCMLKSVQTVGLLQMSGRVLSRGTTERGLFGGATRIKESRRINRYSRVVLSAAERPFGSPVERLVAYFERRQMATMLSVRSLLGLDRIKLTTFRTKFFEDFIWRTLFSKTLPASDFSLVTAANQLVCSVPWNTMHRAGLHTRSLSGAVRYPRLNTNDIDIFIGQTPYPARFPRSTAVVIRYHDAIPLLMPHTIADKSLHQATHYYALESNVKSGAYFACVSESTRSDLLNIFPEVRDRAVTIHNMVSHHYFLEECSPSRVPGIIRSRLHSLDQNLQEKEPKVAVSPEFFSLGEQERFYKKALTTVPFKYLLVVGTIEPRKNHSRAIAAWEVLKAEIDPALKLVIVGGLGWDFKELVQSFKTWVDRGELLLLSKVPAPDLRVLYRHAAATICPSLAEGFDFSGIECMRSGGIVIASDIPVHREIYDGAAEYFDPYSTTSLVLSTTRTLYDADSESRRTSLRSLGQEVSARYVAERILPQWSRFLARVLNEQKSRFKRRSSLEHGDFSDVIIEDPSIHPGPSSISSNVAEQQ